ncbi:large ribosomal RNA subunit accumulation protein YCED homolog 2, chloroplastic [Primulina tabacum]|uniref:large ribosomal RNA subunit accumulation protein YCED homolog 2, chloroplastic n=1 Tax=Primulina tabacum TaxID=48773 RepID=UPI003F592DB5
MAARLSPNNHITVAERINRSISIPPYNYHFLIKRNPQQVCPYMPKASNKYTQQHSQLISMQQLPKKKLKSRLVTISLSDGGWHGKWNCDYIFSLRQLLHQQDVPDDVDKDADVSITLCIEKHAGLGMSVEGRMKTCFTRKCCNCCTPYLRQIDTAFKVWILPSRSSSKQSDDDHQLLPDIGGDDTSVIYVKPGCEADLDSLIQDTICLATSIRETCSEVCENSEPKLHHLGAQNAASIDKRWYKLLELKNTIS